MSETMASSESKLILPESISASFRMSPAASASHKPGWSQIGLRVTSIDLPFITTR